MTDVLGDALSLWEYAARHFEDRSHVSAWRGIARPEQLLPPLTDPWLLFLMAAGRGGGKTAAGTQGVAELMRRYPGCRVALVGPTFADGRDTIVEGEALALDTYVPTPDGYTTMGDLRAGDVIYGGDGQPCRVTEAFPVLTGRPCYEVALKGGARIVADAEHKWLTEDYETRAYTRRHGITARRPTVISTEQMRATLRHRNGQVSQANHGIRISAVDADHAAGLPIDPYVLGAWLGDGTSKGGDITTADPELLEEMRRAGYTVTDRAPTSTQGLAATYGVLGLKAQIRAAGLLRNKHVPTSYLRAGRSQRLALVQGLMDTDGYVSVRGQCEFVNKNRALADALVDLLGGLGVKVSAPRSKTTSIGTTHWLVKFTTTQQVFRLNRKLDRLPVDYRDARHWHVQTVEPVPSVPVRCIAVDSPDRTFLVTRHHVRTHNSGLLSALDDTELRGGSRDAAWNRSIGELFLANGSRARLFSSETPSKLRGPQHHVAYADEIAVWRDAHADPGTVDTTWSNLMLGLRLPAMPGWPADYAPRVIATTTPRRCALLRVPAGVLAAEPHRAGLTQWSASVARFSHWTTFDNLANLAPAFRRAVVDPLRGTRLGRQELDAVLLDDVEGALVQQSWIDRGRVAPDAVPVLAATVTAVDPATTVTDSSDETGILTVAVDGNGEGYVLDDSSGKYSPEEWAEATWKAAIVHGSQAVVVEDNQGGDMVETTLKVAWHALQREQHAKGITLPGRPPIVRVHPSGPAQGKWVRAQPVALLYEQSPGRIHHAAPPGTGLDRLEDQLTAWTGDPAEPSPDRVDALVHGLSWLLFPARRRTPKDRLPTTAPSQRWAQAGGRR